MIYQKGPTLIGKVERNRHDIVTTERDREKVKQNI